MSAKSRPKTKSTKSKARPHTWTAVKDRSVVLNGLRRLKMARSAHAYVRGSTARFYEWLAEDTEAKIPDGPPVWICGDCHIGNMGPIANARGVIDIQIRDLDQTVIGNPAYDLIRLGLSLASSARGSDLPGIMTARMIEHLIDGYESAIDGDNDAVLERPNAVEHALSRAVSRKWKHLAQERIRDTRPGIPLGKRFWPISKAERAAIDNLFTEEKTRRLVTSLRSRDSEAAIEVLDAAYWVKGCSSLGLGRYAVLVGIEGGENTLIDIKSAVAPLAPKSMDATMPRDNGERVADGAWHLSPALGERLLPARMLDGAVFLRELLPQDLKFEIEQLDPDEAVKVARFLAAVVGKAHARQMDELTRRTWRGELRRRRSKTLDAPSWLWTSVVRLMMLHEGAYLDHCRRYCGGD